MVDPKNLIAGIDLACEDPCEVPAAAACAIVVCSIDAERCEVAREAIACGEVSEPYRPSYLAKRELPLMLQAWEKLLRKKSHARELSFLVDGAGIAHPRGAGLACAFGEATGCTTVGVAKSWLCGSYTLPPEPQLPKGKVRFRAQAARESALKREDSDQVMGAVLRPGKSARRLLFVSPGWPTDFSVDDSVALVRRAITVHIAPEPLRLAHLAAKEALQKV
jgi:deoxyribonuclease V